MGLEETCPAVLIIPTGLKSKLGKHESYPVGAELLSRELAGLSMFKRLSVSFLRGGVTWSEIAAMTRFPILNAEYNFEQWMPGQVFGRPSWSIVVRPVPRELRGLIKARLVEGGFAKVRHWFERNADLWGSDGIRRFELQWDQSERKIVFEERSNSGPKVGDKHREHSRTNRCAEAD